jgi:hypothetical protein
LTVESGGRSHDGTRLSGGTSDHHLIRGGVAGLQRLRVLARVMWPTTRELLERVGVPEEHLALLPSRLDPV